MGLTAGESSAMNDGGNQASQKNASASASTGRGSGRPVQPPTRIGAPLPANGIAPTRGCITSLAREFRRSLEQPRRRAPLGVRRAQLGHRQFVGARRPPRHREGGERERGHAAVLFHARGERAQRAPGALDGRVDLDRAHFRGGGVVDRQRARRALGVIDRGGERAQQDRREVAAVGAAPGPPAGGDRRCERAVRAAV